MFARKNNIVDMKDNYTYYAIMADQGRIFRKVLETISAISAALLGLMFVSAGYRPLPDIFLPMSIIAPAWVWGSIMIALSAIRIIVIIVNGYWPYSHRARKWLSGAFIFGVWLPLAACFWWNFQGSLFEHDMQTYPGLSYSIFAMGTEFLIYYAHSAFVYAASIQRGQNG